MRLIVPLILIALLLPYATGEDKPTGEWLIPPDRSMGVAAAAADDDMATRAPVAGIACRGRTGAWSAAPASPPRAATQPASTRAAAAAPPPPRRP